jgi:hypothetical protein
VILTNILIGLDSSNWKIDNLHGDFYFTYDNIWIQLYLHNYRKNNAFRVTKNKKLICGNRKDPTSYGFLRNTDDGPTTVDQLNEGQNKNKKYILIILRYKELI